MLLELLQTNPVAFVVTVAPLMLAIVLHELGHAVAANAVGDPTARWMGRITLNPLKHLDLFGSIALLLVGFGWAKPVPINPRNFRSYRSGLLIVSLAGIAVNLTLMAASILALRLLTGDVSMFTLNALAAHRPDLLNLAPAAVAPATALAWSAWINTILAVFNLMPVPPLDGSRVVQAVAPPAVGRGLLRLEQYGFLLVIIALIGFRQEIFSVVGVVLQIAVRLLG